MEHNVEVEAAQPQRRLLHRQERRQQIVDAAKHAFVRGGFAATSLDDVARQAGITKVLIYRHFDSKAGLYRAVLDDFLGRLNAAVGNQEQMRWEHLDTLVAVARDDPDGFRLLFRHAAREPDFRGYADAYQAEAAAVAEQNLREVVPDPKRRQWAANLVLVVAAESIMTWLDVGQPGPESVAASVRGIVAGLLAAITENAEPGR